MSYIKLTEPLPTEPLEKRTWYYAGRPCQDYDIPGCARCGNEDIVYSEFKERLWCAKCEIDFEPVHWGLFSGPIAWELCAILGISFDRINLETNKYERATLQSDKIEYIPVDELH